MQAAVITTALDHLFEHLPRRPFSTDSFREGLYHHSQMEAISSRYIQLDKPYQTAWLKVDADRPDSGAAWIDAGLPPPNFLIANNENGHAHYLYAMKTPVITSINARIRPMRLMAAVEHGYVRALGGDPSYTGLICKNPLHPHWHTHILSTTLYELKDMLDALPYSIATKRIDRAEYTGFSRNVDLFDTVRVWAYGHALKAKEQGQYDAWEQAVLSHAVICNAFTHPLPYSEIRATARSIAKWTWMRAETLSVSPLGGLQRSKIRSWEREAMTETEIGERRQAGAEWTAMVKRSRTFDAISMAIAQLAGAGIHTPSLRQIATSSKLSLDTIKRWRRAEKAGKSMN